MVTMKHVRKSIKLFRNDMADRRIQRHNQRQWLEAIKFLGDKWILANPVQTSRTHQMAS